MAAYRSVRALSDPNTALGSEGSLLSTELRTPVFHLLGQEDDRDYLQFGVFMDYASSGVYAHPDLSRIATNWPASASNVNYGSSWHLDLQFIIGRAS